MTEPNRGKITTPGWPDPTDWVNRLYQQLAGRYEVYEAEPDVLLKRNKAGAMLAEVVSALMEFPPFKRDTVHMPLKDLLIFLADLDRGRDHPWSRTSTSTGTNITTASQVELKSWVRAVYGLLRSNRFGAVEAYKHIANGLTESGRTGRDKTEPFRWRLVQAWCAEDETPRDAVTRERVHQFWNHFQALMSDANVVDSWGDTIPDKDKKLAAEFANQCWQLEQIRDRSFSGTSN